MVIGDADTSAMEPLIKQEPALLVNLMRITNSIGNGSNRQISTAREAITLLGRRQLQRWLQLLLFCTNGSGKTHAPLLNMVATRARTMELLAEHCDTRDADPDSAFLTGILSLLPALLGVSMDEVLKTLAVERGIQGALINGSGTLGTLLQLLRCWEEDATLEFTAILATLPPLTGEDFTVAVSEAMGWAAGLGQ